MMVVSDVDDIFVPLLDDLLVNLSDSRNVVDTFLDNLPTMFQNTMNVECAFGPALKATFKNQLGGKLLIFQNTLPSIGVGRLRLRGDDAQQIKKLHLGTISKYIGGQVYYYPSFQSSVHGEKLKHELTRETTWEVVMRIRCGKGVRFTSYHRNFMLRSIDLLDLPAVDCDKAFAMQMSLEETLLTTQTVYFQVTLLYTSSCGERHIRVHTAAAPVVADLGKCIVWLILVRLFLYLQG